MTTTLHIDNVSGRSSPAAADVLLWVETALAHTGHAHPAEISLRIVDEPEIQALNSRYRGSDKPTNVLSFSAQLPAELELPVLGDIAICAAVVEAEAHSQGKAADAHWAHIVIHGTLHLLGYDHQAEAEALTMEALETRILAALEFPAPYT